MAEIVALRPGLWLVESSTDEFDVRAAVVAGEKAAMVWDTLTRPSDMEGVAEVVSGRHLKVVYSHGDWDHVFGTAGLGSGPKTVYGHEGCLVRFQDELPATLAQMKADTPGIFDRVELVAPTQTFWNRLSLDLGGLTVQLQSLPGHTGDTVVAFIPEWGVLLAGDAVESPLPFLNPGSPVEEWASSLEVWEKRLMDGHGPTARVIPSHGEVGGPELLGQTAAYLRAIQQGEEAPPRTDLSPFYNTTHEQNLRLARMG